MTTILLVEDARDLAGVVRRELVVDRCTWPKGRYYETHGRKYVLVINDKRVPLHFENRIKLPVIPERRRGRPSKAR
jgi:hypothetical protein